MGSCAGCLGLPHSVAWSLGTGERAELQGPGSAPSRLCPCPEGWQCPPHLPLVPPTAAPCPGQELTRARHLLFRSRLLLRSGGGNHQQEVKEGGRKGRLWRSKEGFGGPRSSKEGPLSWPLPSGTLTPGHSCPGVPAPDSSLQGEGRAGTCWGQS